MNFKNKIIDFDQAGRLFKKIRSTKKIIHCHGVFDLVHPGHIRHLSYCKSKADNCYKKTYICSYNWT